MQRASRLEGLLIGFCVAVMAWPATLSRPTAGLDMSWVLALSEAHHRGVRFGRDLVFQYGPLGFLATGAATHGGQFLLAVAYRIGLIGLYFGALRRGRGAPLPLRVVAGAALLFGATNAPAELLVPVAFAVAFAARSRRVHEPEGSGWRSLAHWAGRTAAFVGVGLVMKFSVGVALAVLGAGDLIALSLLAGTGLSARSPTSGSDPGSAQVRGRTRPVRDALSAAGLLVAATALAVVVAWLAAGQRVGDLVVFLTRSAEVARGYTGSLSLENPSDGFGSALAVLVAVTFVAVVVRWWRAEHGAPPPSVLLAELAVCVPVLYVVFRAAYTRMDAGHTFLFAGVAGLCCAPYLAAAGFAGSQRRGASIDRTATDGFGASDAASRRFAGLVLGVAAVVTVAQAGQSVTAVLDPAPRVREFVGAIDLVVRPNARRDLLRAAAASFPEASDVDALLGQVSGRGRGASKVAVIPGEVSMIWRFGLAWAQPPVLQRYTSYTAALDALDADFLAGPAAPENVLYQSGRIVDGRWGAAEAPRSLRALSCWYGPVAGKGTWTLLRRRPVSRCGRRLIVSTFTIRNGQSVTIPMPAGTPRSLYGLTIAAPRRGWVERLHRLFLRPSGSDRVTVNGRSLRLIDASFGAEIPLSGPDGPGDALVTGLVGDVSAVPAALTLSGPGWRTLTVTLTAYALTA